VSGTPDQADPTPARSPLGAEFGTNGPEFPSSGSRIFNYFTPQRVKATVYEDVTVDVQPDPTRYLVDDWSYAFPNGPGGFPSEWTAAKSSDWHWFRDPNQEWEQTIFKNNARVARVVEHNIANALSEGAFAHWTARWTRIVQRHVGAWMHAEHGLGMHVFLPAQRDAPTNMINNALAVNAMHKLRSAQDLVLFNLEVSETRADFDGAAHLDAWRHDRTWQPARESVERLTSIRDWCEALIAANLAFEPLVGELFRSGFVMAAAAVNGDFVTPTIMGAIESDFDRDLAFTRELVGGLTNDERHGAENRLMFSRWLAQPVAMGLRSAVALAPVWSEAENCPTGFDAALSSARKRVLQIVGELGITAPAELGR
jgi:propane monooxygenase small subunit